jgi:hypothetical protein
MLKIKKIFFKFFPKTKNGWSFTDILRERVKEFNVLVADRKLSNICSTERKKV